MIRLTKLALALSLLGLLFAGSLVYAGRAPAQFACIQLFESTSGNWIRGVITVDLNTGHITRDPRHSPPPSAQRSPDGEHVAYWGYKDGLYTLYAASHSARRVVSIQRNMESPGWPPDARHLWSPDGQQLALIYGERPNFDYGSPYTTRYFVTVASADGQAKTSHQLMPRGLATPIGVTMPYGWSADGRYLAVGVWEGADAWNYHFWSVRDSKQIAFDMRFTYPDGRAAPFMARWSPQGHRFAAVRQKSGRSELIILSPEHGIEHILPLLADRYPDVSLHWSPNGRWLAVEYKVEGLWAIFDTEAGVQLPGSATILAESGARAVGWFDGEADQILYLLKSGTTMILGALHIDPAGVLRYQIIRDDLAASFMWEPFGSFDWQLRRFVRHGRRQMIVPYANADKLALDVMTVDGTNRVTLAEGVTPDEAFMNEWQDSIKYPVWTWSPDGAWVALIWSAGLGEARKVHVAWVRADGTDRREVSFDAEQDAVQYAQRLNWVDAAHFTFLARRATRVSMELVNVITGETQTLIAPLPGRLPPFNTDISPDRRTVAFLIDRGDLYIASVDAPAPRKITAGVQAGPLWSPNGSRFAFVYYNLSDGKTALRVVSTDGAEMGRYDLSRWFTYGFSGELTWTHCD